MSSIEPRPPIHVGDVAPDFTLPTVQREGTVSLADYRDNSAVLLVLNRGLWCSFCRRYIVQLGGTWEHLQRLGVDMLAIVASELERARFYVRARPIRVPMAADPERLTHRAYGLPMPPMTPEIDQTWQKMRVQLDRTAVTPADLEQLTAAVGAARDTAQPTGAMGGADQLPLWDFVFLQRRLYPDGGERTAGVGQQYHAGDRSVSHRPGWHRPLVQGARHDSTSSRTWKLPKPARTSCRGADPVGLIRLAPRPRTDVWRAAT